MDDIDHAVASPVQDSYRALDGPDIKGDPARAVSQTIVGVALQAVGEHGGESCHCLLHPPGITEQSQVGRSEHGRYTAAHLPAILAVRPPKQGIRGHHRRVSLTTPSHPITPA